MLLYLLWRLKTEDRRGRLGNKAGWILAGTCGEWWAFCSTLLRLKQAKKLPPPLPSTPQKSLSFVRPWFCSGSHRTTRCFLPARSRANGAVKRWQRGNGRTGRSLGNTPTWQQRFWFYLLVYVRVGNEKLLRATWNEWSCLFLQHGISGME